jgi:hypothetical protein
MADQTSIKRLDVSKSSEITKSLYCVMNEAEFADGSV